jgi:hypothetical protein
VGRNWTARNSGAAIPETKTLLVPAGVNFRIFPPSTSARKRLPPLPKANPLTELSPVANVLSVLSGAYLRIKDWPSPLPADTNRLPKLSKAKSLRSKSGEDAVAKRLEVPSGANFQISDAAASKFCAA